ncbi:MAG: hypothetical protein ACOYZ8_06200 [Chloroflexota bacterium]
MASIAISPVIAARRDRRSLPYSEVIMKRCDYILLFVPILAACNSGNSIVSASPSPLLFPTATATPTLSSYIPVNPVEAPAPNTATGCIPPIIISGYPHGEIYITPSPKQNVLPSDWEMVSTVPDEFTGKLGSGLLLVQPREDHDEIWIDVYDDPIDNGDRKYYIYRTDTKEWRRAPTPPSSWVFLDSNNNVWAKTVSYDRSVPIFYRLDEAINRFVPVMDIAENLSNGHVPSGVKIGADGLLWFIFRDNQDKTSLYSFDPVTLEAKGHLSGDYYEEVEMDKNGNLYLLQRGVTLVKYNPPTGNVLSANIPRTDEEFGDSNNMYLDHENRLWISDRVWFDITATGIDNQYVVIRSPVFIDYVDYLLHYRWVRPLVALESIDGRLWYRSTRGNAWFNPNNGEWCLFTTYNSNIVQDSKYDLWMLIENSLYRLQFDL